MTCDVTDMVAFFFIGMGLGWFGHFALGTTLWRRRR